MKLSIIVAVVVLAGVASAISEKNDCNKGPSYWCRDQDTAIKCGVQAFCNLLKDDSKIKFQPTVKAAPAVNVSFYYESLCPGCRGVWADQLYPTFQALGGSGIVNFEFVPYGNAREQAYGSSWIFTCQHGASECLGNKIETCAIHYNPEPAKIIPFLHCLEQYGPTTTNGAYCAGIAKIEWNAINTCAYSSEGSSLEHEMAVKTDSLNPPHQYVPWLTLNGRPSTALSSNMLATVCNAYTGTKPAACSRSQNPESKRCNKE